VRQLASAAGFGRKAKLTGHQQGEALKLGRRCWTIGKTQGRASRYNREVGEVGADSSHGKGIQGRHNQARQLIDGASFGPDSLKAIGEAFNAAWVANPANFRRLSVARIDAGYGATSRFETMVKPGRELTGLEPDPFSTRRSFLDASAMASGVEGTLPRQTSLSFSSITAMDVSLSDTSRPT
jgi:hypothetical protein